MRKASEGAAGGPRPCGHGRGTRGSEARTYGLVGGAVLLWASWPALGATVAAAPPFLVLGASASIGALLSFALALWQDRGSSFAAVPMGTLAFAAFGLVGNNAFYLTAIARIGPAEANVVHYLWPVLLVLLAALLNRRAPRAIQMLGVAAGFGGVVVALWPRMGGDFDATGVLLGACGALTFAVYSVGRSRATDEADVVGPALGLGGITSLGAHLVLEPAYAPGPAEWLIIALLGIGPFALANVLWDRATRAGAAATIASLAFLTPLVGMGLLAVLGIGEVTSATLAGALLAIVGAVLGSLSR